MDEAIAPQSLGAPMDFALNADAIATLRNRNEVGLSWIADLIQNRDGDLIKNDELELPAELECWSGEVSIYAQGPTDNDAARIGTILLHQFEGARTFANIDTAVEKIIRAELTRAGIAAGPTESRPHFADPSDVSFVVPVTFEASN
jgi:hypothetical protein